MKVKILYIPLILLQIFLSTCNIKLDERPGISQDIADSKNRDVFINEYQAALIEMKADSDIQINEAWIEKKWRFSEFKYNDSDVQEGMQIGLKIDENSIKEFNKSWTIKRRGSDGFIGQVGDDVIWINESNLINRDTIYYEIYAGKQSLEMDNKSQLGRLRLVKMY